MNYKGFTIICRCGVWRVLFSSTEEWLAQSKQDAQRQVDQYINIK